MLILTGKYRKLPVKANPAGNAGREVTAKGKSGDGERERERKEGISRAACYF